MRRDKEARRSFRAGVFLAAGAAAALAMLVVVGRSQRPFGRRVTLQTSFANTAGLVVGAPVRLAGVDIGAVQQIRFAPDLRVKEVSVVLSVQGRYLDRLRADSTATLVPKGLLGDMTVNITVGSPTAAPLRNGSTVPSAETAGLAEIVTAVNHGIGDVRDLARDVHERLDALVTPAVIADVARTVHATADAADAVKDGHGLAHTLIYDRELTREVRGIAASGLRSARDVEAATARINRIAAAVEGGSGTLHELVYRDDVGPILAEAQRAADDLADFTGAIRRGSGPLHGLAYGHEGEELIANLTTLSRTLKAIGDDVKEGKGTVGALLEDPSIYEDLKVLLGKLERNRLLKTLVRFTIEHDGLAR